MKRKFLVVCAVLLCFVFLAPGVSVAAPEHTLRLAQVHPVGSDFDLRAREFAEKIYERTGGRFQINVFSGGILGDWTESFEMLSRGSLEMNMGPANSNFDPKLILGHYFPYLVTSLEEAREFFSYGGWAYNIIRDLWAEHNIKALSVIPVGMAGASMNRLPENYAVPGESTGMRIRVMPIRACELTFNALGFISTPIPFAEAYSAMQTGIVEGQMGGPPFQGYQFRDVNSVWVQYNDYFESWWLSMHLGLWNTLSPEDQEIFMTAAAEVSETQWERSAYVDEHWRTVLREEYGWQIVTLTQEQLDAIAEHVRYTVWPYMEEFIGTELMDRVFEESGIPRPASMQR